MSVSDHLINKWRKVFNYRDRDNDGILKEKDLIRYSENFVKIYGERAAPAREIATLLWSTFHPREYKSEITEQEFVDNYTYLYENDLPLFRKKVEKYCHLSFNAIDSNGDGEISLQEYTVYQNSFEVHNQDYIELVFSKIDTDGNGTISRKEFVDEMMNFCFEDAPHRIPEFYDDYLVKHFKKK